MMLFCRDLTLAIITCFFRRPNGLNGSVLCFQSTYQRTTLLPASSSVRSINRARPRLSTQRSALFTSQKRTRDRSLSLATSTIVAIVSGKNLIDQVTILQEV
jgi:hypothetical protein